MSLERELSTTSTATIVAVPATGKMAEAEHRCASAKLLQEAGDYEGARAALGDLWGRIGERPNLTGLNETCQAELLLRTGALTGWLGSANQIEGAQEIAKDLISESARKFAELGLIEKTSEAEIGLAVCYWREGALDEARVTLREVLQRLGDTKKEERLRALATLALVEWSATRYNDALQIQMEAAPLFEESTNHSLKGSFHVEYATVLKNLGMAEGREDYIDRAFIEYAAASYHFEQAGHLRYVARVENNLGMLLLKRDRFVEAHQHLNRSRALFVKFRDKGSIAQVDETRAKTFLAEGRDNQAEMVARGSVRLLEEGDERAVLAEALTTHATALARLGRSQRATTQFRRAIEVAQQAGALDMAGLAALALLEECSASLSLAEMRDSYLKAESLLADSQDARIGQRMGQCARTIIAAERSRGVWGQQSGQAALADESTKHHNGNGNGQTAGTTANWSGCALEAEVLRYEGDLIKRALEAANGSVTRAARMLGITHQGLAFILNGRHKSLLNVRTPVKRRRRSILRSRVEH